MTTELTIISYPVALFTGMTVGASHCTFSCTPFFSTYVMGTREGASEGLKSFLSFNMGRIFMYMVLGMVSGSLRRMVGADSGSCYSSTVFSILLMLVGLLMYIHPIESKQCTKKTRMANYIPRHAIFNPAVHLFAMGMAFAAIPCAPALSVLAYSAQMPSPMSSGILMALFGIGVSISPLIVIAVVAGFLSRKIKACVPQYKTLFQRVSGVILIGLGGCALF